MNDAGLKASIARCSSLTSLNLTGLAEVTHDGIAGANLNPHLNPNPNPNQVRPRSCGVTRSGKGQRRARGQAVGGRPSSSGGRTPPRPSAGLTASNQDDSAAGVISRLELTDRG